jgi:hypothetical protein
MVAYTYNIPSGIAGMVTRPTSYPTIEQQLLNTSTPPTAFGVAVKLVSGKILPIQSGDYQNDYGVIVRPYPTSGNGTNGLGVATPNTAFAADILKSGYISVVLNNGTAAAGGKVYVRVGNASGAKVIGGFEATNDTAVAAGTTIGTGTQTAGTLSATGTTPPGVYTVLMTSGSAFSVLDANGAPIFQNGVFATQYTLDNGLSFKMTTGGTPTAGDKTPITVTQNTFQISTASTYFTGPADASGNVEIAYNV